MSQWDAKGVAKCEACGTTRPVASLANGKCEDVAWCSKQRAVPEAIAREWPRMRHDLDSFGATGFEVDGAKYVFYQVAKLAQSIAERLEDSGVTVEVETDPNKARDFMYRWQDELVRGRDE